MDEVTARRATFTTPGLRFTDGATVARLFTHLFLVQDPRRGSLAAPRSGSAARIQPVGVGCVFPDGASVVAHSGGGFRVRDDEPGMALVEYLREGRHIVPLTGGQALELGIRVFVLDRQVCTHGPTGVVAFGVCFPDGRAAHRWNSHEANLSPWASFERFCAVHCHRDAATGEAMNRVDWIEPTTSPADLDRLIAATLPGPVASTSP